MPKKTKKEKILAEARRIVRHHESIQSLEITPKTANVVESKNPYTFSPGSVRMTNAKISAADISEFSIIRKDLIKTVILTVAAVFLELVIYWQFRGK
jgi:hypothetical protein